MAALTLARMWGESPGAACLPGTLGTREAVAEGRTWHPGYVGKLCGEAMPWLPPSSMLPYMKQGGGGFAKQVCQLTPQPVPPQQFKPQSLFLAVSEEPAESHGALLPACAAWSLCSALARAGRAEGSDTS